MTEATTEHRHTNRLIDETSPYLLQHAHNPVDWYPWGERALAAAKQQDRLILLSIGYSACHWCHVMERESFENDAIAAVMNEHYISIKVDREERPDLDDIYMAATLAMNQGQGGWPMTVFLTPDLEPVFAGTYFPPVDHPARPGFPTLLKDIAKAWREDRAKLREQAARFAVQLRQRRVAGSALAIGETELRLALAQYSDDFDSTFGGFGAAPKFPPATGLALLLRLHRRFEDAHALEMARKTLDAMAQGGMYDQVGGGFSRYSTDRQWLVPHFEKMLYDNALLAHVYLEAFQVTGDDSYRRIATETLDYVLREMTSSEGGFYSATDADSEGVEGKFFVWTPQEVEAVLGADDAKLFNAYYDITESGNWEGRSIPNTPRPLADVAVQFKEDPEALRRRLEDLRSKMYDARLGRVKPGLDDKILTAWNGMMIRAFASGHRVLGDVRYLRAAERAADFLLATLVREDGGLWRTYRAGKAHLNAYLEDYAFFCEGLIELYEAGAAVRYLREAERLVERTVADFSDPEGGSFYHTAGDHEKLLMRYREGTDGATPAANAVAAAALVRLSYHLDREDLRALGLRSVRAYGSVMAKFPRAFARSLIVVDMLLEGPVELAFVGPADSPELEALRRAAARHFIPNRIEAVYDPASSDGQGELPLLRGKETVNGRAALFVCHNFACQAPIVAPEAVESALSSVRGHGEATSITVRLEGCATEQGTARYASRFGQGGGGGGGGHRPFGTTRLTSSIVGFGGYRVADGVAEHREALRRALHSGVNVIDTSPNYTDGASERLIGGVLHELIDEGEVARDEIIVVSKIGYVQGESHALAEAREKDGRPFPDMVKIQEGLWHCIHPDFLEQQLLRSLDRLELDTLDVCLLHNPEYFLAASAAQGVRLARARDEFYGRLERAFSFLEDQVALGRLRWYGVSSNTMTAAAESPDAVSLSRVLDAVVREGEESHFAVIQLPLNLYESGALFEKNNGPGRGKTALETAREHGLAVLASRPLNAYTADRMVRLADVPESESAVDCDRQIERVAKLEEEFRNTIASDVTVQSEAPPPDDYFRWAERLAPLRTQQPGLEQWAQIEGQVSYQVGRIAAALGQTLSGDVAERWTAWRERYFTDLNELLAAMRSAWAREARAQSEAVTSKIHTAIPELPTGETLSRNALWVVASTPGVTCVLNGMRSVEYVRDAIGIMEWKPLDNVERAYRAVLAVRA
ncbi:MAG: DUF255 domain-containing protein [Gemmatimonadetes bacterium]|nr:DUF255 domain-containing protein [Gemmatimonadota bacterium]